MKQLLAVALLGCTHSAPPPTSPSATPPAPLAFYVGEWKCDGTEYDANGVAKPYPGLGVTVSADYASWIRIVVYDQGKQITSELMGVDPKGKYHHVFTDNEGGYGSLTSPGWFGNELVLDEDHPDPAGKTRMKLIKIDDRHYKHTAETDTGAGFKLEFVKSCSRV